MKTNAISLARRRARLRKRSGGAAIFIVAVTLGVLAVTGVYALAATTNDVKAAGHMRQAMQGQHAAEFSMMTTAETFTPRTAKLLLSNWTGAASGSPQVPISQNCKSAKPWTGNGEYKAAETCLVLKEESIVNIVASENAMLAPTGGSPPAPQGCATIAKCPMFWGGPTGSFGEVPLRPFLRVEVTNAVPGRAPPGMSLGSGEAGNNFTQVTVSVFVEMKTASTVPAETVLLGRGRITVGPY